MPPSIFSRIIARDIPAYIVAENASYLAFLDMHPLTEGHTLVVPKKEIDYIFQQPDDVLSELLPFAKRVARKIEAVVSCRRIGLAVVGLEVPHTHIHLIPIDRVEDMSFTRPPLTLSEEEMKAWAKRIQAGTPSLV